MFQFEIQTDTLIARLGEARPRQGKIQLQSRQGLLAASLVSPKCANSSPWRGKCDYNSLPGVVGKKNVKKNSPRGVLARKICFFFLRQGILARLRHAPTYPAKWCLEEKTPWLSLNTTILWSIFLALMGYPVAALDSSIR